MQCSNCKNTEISEEDNFCVMCGTKLREICKCWVVNQNNYNCGENSCPGYNLFKTRKTEYTDCPVGAEGVAGKQ